MSVRTPWISVKEEPNSYAKKLQLLRQHIAEQIRLAAVEKAYIERTRELIRRELDLAKKEFARAKLVWEQAREEVEKAERLKEIATRRVSFTCLEITCHNCHQPFQA
ncbi:protein indeterminate-domain 16-like [Zingiber officinale]|nr:protein indeterminate-domain 16-like [Zingiber officinale]